MAEVETPEWSDEQLRKIKKAVWRFPARGNRCDAAARAIHRVAIGAGKSARIKVLKPKNGAGTCVCLNEKSLSRLKIDEVDAARGEHHVVVVDGYVYDAVASYLGCPKVNYLVEYAEYVDCFDPCSGCRMPDAPRPLIDLLDDRIDAVIERPRMFGGYELAEHLVVMLLQIRGLARRLGLRWQDVQ